MSNKMKHLGTRVDEAFYDQVKVHAEGMDMSISEFVRVAVEQISVNRKGNRQQVSADLLTDVPQTVATLSNQLELKDQQLERKEKQLEQIQAELNEQIRLFAQELSESRRGGEEAGERSDTIIAQMTQQLKRTTSQLEDMRSTHKQGWWGRVFTRSA